ncbi:2-oxoacid:ferredoxin oxidoreductase subunit beta [Candidatus Roizmanbacteria bacterium]|nr:2-oxoacid:ferredoxin oxidoreductase subunit beta [Candidatus Roizmanbacteria bacterium]
MVEDFTGFTPTWCPGCGDWGIGVAIKKALTDLNLKPSSVEIVFDIGCSGNMNDFLNAYAMHALHGRSIPNAIGIKLANHAMPVLVVGGDGGIYGEGGNHFLHACRGNHDITVLVHDNSVYGLTTGQVAPTAQKGMKSKSTPEGILEVPVNPLALALTQGATFVANAFAGDVNNLIELIKEGVKHRGFSLINILQPCVTFNKVNTYQYYLKNIYKLDQNHEKTNYAEALHHAVAVGGERYPIGILYQVAKPAYHEQLPQLSQQTLVTRSNYRDFNALLKDFT